MQRLFFWLVMQQSWVALLSVQVTPVAMDPDHERILAKLDKAPPEEIDGALLEEEAEQTLTDMVVDAYARSEPLLEEGNYEAVLALLAELREPVDAFFDQVMVMAEDPAVRDNRLALLTFLRDLFLNVADISLLQE